MRSTVGARAASAAAAFVLGVLAVAVPVSASEFRRGEGGLLPVQLVSAPSGPAEHGLRPATRTIQLVDLREPVAVESEHGVVDATTGRAIDVPEGPQLAIIDDVAPGTELSIRTRHGRAGWSDWSALETGEADSPDGTANGEQARSDGRAGVGPIWLGHGVDRIEIAGITGSEFLTLETLEIDETTRDTGPTLARSAAAAAGGSFVEPRSSWATAEMQWACLTGPDTAQVEGMVVHHTAGGNSYTAADVPAIIRAIWRYHVVNRGWCDIAYNFLVDKFGQVWEGRQGGIAKGIVGGHTYGFNTGTSGVAQLGNFDTAGPPSAMTTATSLIVGWKLGTHGVDPTGTSVYKNRAPDTSPKGVPPGGTVTLPSVVGHRDLGSTSCPGANTYARRSTIRTSARTGAHALALHWSFLGRAPTLNEYRDLATGAQASGLLATADDLSHSREYAGVVITDLYRKVLRRTPDGPGMNYWLDQLRDGMTVAEMSVYFYGGREYYDRAGNDSAFVDALYRDILHRSPDVGGKLYWTAEMARGTTPPTVAAAFVDSDESRRDRVKRLYLRFLGRSPDPEGHAYWADVLRTSDDLALATFLALSTEYYRRVFR